jgi:hypothetical protein
MQSTTWTTRSASTTIKRMLSPSKKKKIYQKSIHKVKRRWLRLAMLTAMISTIKVRAQIQILESLKHLLRLVLRASTTIKRMLSPSKKKKIHQRSIQKVKRRWLRLAMSTAMMSTIKVRARIQILKSLKHLLRLVLRDLKQPSFWWNYNQSASQRRKVEHKFLS